MYIGDIKIGKEYILNDDKPKIVRLLDYDGIGNCSVLLKNNKKYVCHCHLLEETTDDRLILLKRFGILDVNRSTLGHKHTNNGLWHVLFNGDWHEVPECDIELIGE